MSPHDLTDHFLNRAIVIEPARVLFVPMPKSACSSIMWALAEVAGIPTAQFETSLREQPTARMTIHDMSRWSDEFRLTGRSERDLGRILTQEGWLRFTVVRDPIARLWSAWQSKVLAREAQMVWYFGDEEWFPRESFTPMDIVEDYRRFVAELANCTKHERLPALEPSIANPHWDPQTSLLGDSGLTLLRVSRLSELDDTIGVLLKHLVDLGFAEPTMPGVNRSLLPFAQDLNGPTERVAIWELYRSDFEILGFAPPEEGDEGDLSEWVSRVEELLEPLRAVIERNERIGFFAKEAQRLQRAEARADVARRILKLRSTALASAQAANARVRQRLDALAAREQHSDAKLREAGESLSIARANLAFAQNIASEAAHRAVEAEQQFQAIEQSRAWRWTSPLRRIGEAWRRRLGDKSTGGPQ
jgi:Sulfotransferase family